MSEWISVKERLPKVNQWILGLHYHCYIIARWDGLMWFDRSQILLGYDFIHHWMPLPELPTTDSSKDSSPTQEANSQAPKEEE